MSATTVSSKSDFILSEETPAYRIWERRPRR